jgi:Flp pilus assembly pilin Flp
MKRVTAISSDSRGSVTVEYTVLLVLVAMSCALAMVTLGAPLVRMFATYQTWLLLPFP